MKVQSNPERIPRTQLTSLLWFILVIALVVLPALCQSLGIRASIRSGGIRWCSPLQRPCTVTVAVEVKKGNSDDANSAGASPRVTESHLRDLEIWLELNGVDTRGSDGFLPAVKLQYFPQIGIGLEATRDLEQDSTVASIPRRICLSSDPSDAPPETLRAWVHSMLPRPQALTPTPDLDHSSSHDACVVTLQLFLEQCLDARSTFAPWLATLPHSAYDLNLPALWEEEDRSGLAGTLLLRDTLILLEEARMETERITQVLTSALKAFAGCQERIVGDEGIREGDKLPITKGGQQLRLEELEQALRRLEKGDWLLARSLVQSRAYWIGGSRPGYLLMPLIDFANHDDKVAYAVCPGDGIFTEVDEVVLTTDRRYSTDQQVFTTYGDMDNAKRLFSFGYVVLTLPPEPFWGGSNVGWYGLRADEAMALPVDATCEVSLSLSNSDPLFALKEEVLSLPVMSAYQGGVSTASLDLRHRPLPSVLVEGPADALIEAVLPFLCLIALESSDLEYVVGGEWGQGGDLGSTDGLRSTRSKRSEVESSREELKGDRRKSECSGCERRVLERRASSPEKGLAAKVALMCLSKINPVQGEEQLPSNKVELKALQIFYTLCYEELQGLKLSSSDMSALLELARTEKGSDQGAICLTHPRRLLCVTIRVGEAIAWSVLLEACTRRQGRVGRVGHVKSLERFVRYLCSHDWTDEKCQL
ncbi:unnamed protein product [Choristocarpus tenellus]